MLISDIEKEGFIKFEEEDKSKKISKEDYDQAIEYAYIYQLKYRNGKVDPQLKAKYKELKNRTKKVENIKNVVFVENAILERRKDSKEYNNFLVVEDFNGICLLYNITTGEDHSFDFGKTLIIDELKTKKTQLYTFNKKDYQDSMNIGYMKSVSLYKNATLMNIHSKEEIGDSDFIEFTDIFENKFFLDVLFNRIYVRKDSFTILKKSKTKQIDIYKNKETINIDNKIFKNSKFNFLKLFYDFD